MTLAEVRERPTTLKFGEGIHGYHESVLRSWHIVQLVRRMLEQNCPPAVLIEVIDDLTGAPHCDLTIHPKDTNRTRPEPTA